MIEQHEHGPIRELRLARPPVNALNPEILAELTQAVKSAPAEGAKAIVLSGQPGLFSAGLDLPLWTQLDREGLAHAVECLFDAMHTLASCPIPVAAAITGHSPAGGAVLALFCDRRVMADGEFRIGLNEVQVGIPLPDVIARAVTLLVGHRGAEEICVPGALMSPAQALDVGFVHQVVAVDEVIPTAVDWCRNLLALPGYAMSRTRSVFRAEVVKIFDEYREADLAEFREAWFRPELQRELRAVVAKLGGK